MSGKSLAEHIDSLVKGAEKFKAEHGFCRVVVGPNSPIAQARLERVAGFWIDVDRVTLVSSNPDEADVVIDGDLVYYSAPERDGVTANDIVGSIDWMGGWSEIDFSSVSWQGVNETGNVHLEGRMGKGLLIEAVFNLREFNVHPDWDSELDNDEQP